MKKNDYEEFIKIDTNNLYIDKSIISSLLFKANNFFDMFSKFFKSFEDFTKEMSGEFKIVNEKLDYLIAAKSQNDIDTNNKPAFVLNSKEKQPEDSKSKSNSKRSENISASESSAPFYEENEKESLTSKMPADSIRKKNEKKKNIIEKHNQNNDNISSTSLNSQFFLYKSNINELIDNNDINNK